MYAIIFPPYFLYFYGYLVTFFYNENSNLNFETIQINSGSNVTLGNYTFAFVNKKTRTVKFQIQVSEVSTSNRQEIIATIPEEFKPSKQFWFIGYCEFDNTISRVSLNNEKFINQGISKAIFVEGTYIY